MARYEIQFPLTFNDGSLVPEELFLQVKDELVARFGGFHVLSPGSPAEGYWRASKDVLYRDQFQIWRVTTFTTPEDGDAFLKEREFFKEYKKTLEERFKQESIWIEVDPWVVPLG
mgnify:CR=1 FL=1